MLTRGCLLSLIIPLALVSGCSNNTGPTAGTMNVSLSSPRDDDGAVLLTIFGGPVDSIESVGFRVHSAQAGADSVKLIITGNLRSGSIARIHIPDTRQASRYSARISQVAARATYAQREPAAYTIALQP